MYKFNLPVAVDEQFFLDILSTAHGCYLGDWARYSVETNKDGYVTQIYDIVDLEDPQAFPRGSVNTEDLVRVVHRCLEDKSLAPEGLFTALAEHDASELDVWACDVLVQLALFREVVYG